MFNLLSLKANLSSMSKQVFQPVTTLFLQLKKFIIPACLTIALLPVGEKGDGGGRKANMEEIEYRIEEADATAFS